jgi:DNA-binding NarL/FixJ family response regulator
MSQREDVDCAENTASALETIAEYHPDLVVLDTGIAGGETSTVIEAVKSDGLRSQCLVLADDVLQRREAELAGADVALLKGYPAAKLFDLIQRIVDTHETQSEIRL